MPKTTYDDASSRATQRMTNGKDTHANYQNCAGALNQLAKWFEDRISSQSTFAVGRMNNVLYIAKQGSVSAALTNQINAATYGCAAVVDCTVKGKIDELKLGGLHAEMMIIRYIVSSLGHAKGALSALGLEIATTKGCCLDCAGFLNEYSIPHTPTNGKASLMWRHPITMTLYRHTGATSDADLKFYESVTYTTNLAQQLVAQSNAALWPPDSDSEMDL